MRSRLALIVALVVATVVLVYALGEAPAAPGPTGSPSTDASAAVGTITPAPTGSESPSPSISQPILSNVSLKPRRVTVPASFRYVVATSTRLIVLDLTAHTAAEVAIFQAPSLEPGFPRAEVTAASDGRVVILSVFVTPQDASVFLLTPETGEARFLVRGAIVRGVISPNGSRFAIARNDSDDALAGLWTGTIGASDARRLIADDPPSGSGPPIPYAFSPSGDLIAFGLPNGDAGSHAAIVAFGSPEARTDHSTGDWVVRGGNITLLGPSSGAEFITNDEVFVWSSRNAFGGQTVAYTYKIAEKRTNELYRPAGDTVIAFAAWSPGPRGFAEAERPMCCGVNLSETVKTVAEDGLIRTFPNRGALVDFWYAGTGNGARLYGIAGGDDATAGVTDLIGGTLVMSFCKRGGEPGSCV
jgi:hypothetical protein